MHLTKHERAAHIAHHITVSGGASPHESTRELCLAVDPDAPDDVIAIVEKHRNSDGTFRVIVDPADKGAKQRAEESRRSAH